jgi:hypothetical protein
MAAEPKLPVELLEPAWRRVDELTVIVFAVV